jgi:hypothetical protein
LEILYVNFKLDDEVYIYSEYNHQILGPAAVAPLSGFCSNALSSETAKKYGTEREGRREMIKSLVSDI